MSDLLGQRYSRAVPAEWPELVEMASTRITEGELTLDDARYMYERAGELDNERLEENRFYGLGLGMCGLVRFPYEEMDKVTLGIGDMVIVSRGVLHGSFAPDDRKSITYRARGILPSDFK